jgi:hypothetical protein
VTAAFAFILVVLLSLAGEACGTSGPGLQRTFRGNFDLFGSDGPTVSFAVSKSGSNITSFSVAYDTAFAWGEEATTTTLPGYMDYLYVETLSFKSHGIPIVGGKFSYDRTDWPKDDLALVSHLEGRITSSAEAVGSVRIVGWNGQAMHVVGDFAWKAAVTTEPSSSL